jgi:hypothetical protein
LDDGLALVGAAAAGAAVCPCAGASQGSRAAAISRRMGVSLGLKLGMGFSNCYKNHIDKRPLNLG